MWPYYILIILPIIVQHFSLQSASLDASNGGRNRKAMWLFWVMLLLLLMLRHESIGRDLPNYEYIFNTISRSNWQNAFERSAETGYSFLNKFVSLFTNDFRWLLIVTSVLSVCFIARSYIKHSNDASLTIALFITTSNFVLLFSGLRQSIAISIGFLAYEFVRKKKLIWFLIAAIIAMLFHTSAFMLLFMYPLYHAKITRNWLLAIIPLQGLVFVFNKQIFGYMGLLLNQFTKYDTEISSTGAYVMLILFIIFAVFAYLIPEESELDADTVGLRNFLLLAVLLQMFTPLHDIAMRINYYYIVFIPLLIPKIINYRSIRFNQVAIVARYVMIIFFVIYFFLAAPKDNVLDTFPYKFFWETV